MDFGEVDICKLGDICDIKEGSSYEYQYPYKKYTTEGKYRVINTVFGKNNLFHSEHNVHAHDILCCIEGSEEEIGDISDSTESAWITDHFVSIIPKRPIDHPFFYFYLASIEDKIRSMRKGKYRFYIKLEDLKNLVIFLPTYEKQLSLFSGAESYERILENYKEEIAILESCHALKTKLVRNSCDQMIDIYKREIKQTAKMQTLELMNIGKNMAKYLQKKYSELDEKRELEREEEDQKEGVDHSTCSICMDKLDNRIVLIPCGHTQFHRKCIEACQEDKCPICNQYYNKIQNIYGL